MRLGDILMFLLVVPVVCSLLFLNDNFFTLRKAFLLVGLTCFFRPITFCCTSLSDPCPTSLSNQYPLSPVSPSFTPRQTDNPIFIRRLMTPSATCCSGSRSPPTTPPPAT